MKEEPRPDSRSSVTSAESDLSVHDRHAAENRISSNSNNINSNNNNNNNSIKSARSSQSSSSATVPSVKSKLSFGISRLLDEPKKSEEAGADSTDEEEDEDEMHEGSSSPVTRSGSSHESSHHSLHPLHPDNHNHHPHLPHAGSGPMYSYSPAFPWFGSYVGKEGIPRESPFLPLHSFTLKGEN